MPLSTKRWLAAGLALAYWLANALLHLEFSNWVTRAWTTPLGTLVPIDYTRELAQACLFLLLASVTAQSARGHSRYLTGTCWVMLLLAIFASNRWLLTTLVEAIHYLQYAIIAVLFASVLDPRRQHWPILEILLLVFWLSVFDEAFQYLYLTARQGSYFDFNDLWLNHLGAMAGVLLFYGFHSRPPWATGMSGVRRALLILSAVVFVGLAGLALAGKFAIDPLREIPPGGFDPGDDSWRLYLQREPQLYGQWQRSFSGGQYFVLSPLQGLGLIVLSILPLALRPTIWPSPAPAAAGVPPSRDGFP